ncbi:MAG: type II toxin-antitoxin system YafQ family toxin [Phascolarctobacterium sp.]|nr:type II toxin-antitoxin system YafQ family toxin [Acidaminococcaceae bacterium]MBQ7884304.1 type II toxin-antitoxin system YafQ family toxin [Phascolarctobacterium sp.]MBQ8418102.1 type II toxin-antitoxin system YafQ family toxin [Phascolarctobacterium sp.]
MKFDVVPSNRFKKDLKLVQSRGYDIELLTEVIEMLADGKELPAKYRDHALVNSRNYKNKRECHILPDWLLIYEICNDELLLYLTRTGTHSDLF